MISKIEYKGELRTEAVHLSSGKTIITDAPIDNQGKGEAFSPTDLVATALGSCMMTIMGIVAKREGIKLDGTIAEVEKVMATNPGVCSHNLLHFSDCSIQFNSFSFCNNSHYCHHAGA